MRTVRILHLALAFAFASTMRAQRADVAVSFAGERSLKVASGQNFWLEGGSLEMGVDAWRGWGVAANVVGTHSASIGSSGIPISLVTTTFGPRYRYSRAGHKLSFYGEGLVGEVNGFDSLFPVKGGAQDSANGLATEIGGGVDLSLSKRFAIRALRASWVRTTLPNATNDVQNNLLLGAGVVVRFGK